MSGPIIDDDTRNGRFMGPFPALQPRSPNPWRTDEKRDGTVQPSRVDGDGSLVGRVRLNDPPPPPHGQTDQRKVRSKIVLRKLPRRSSRQPSPNTPSPVRPSTLIVEHKHPPKTRGVPATLIERGFAFETRPRMEVIRNWTVIEHRAMNCRSVSPTPIWRKPNGAWKRCLFRNLGSPVS